MFLRDPVGSQISWQAPSEIFILIRSQKKCGSRPRFSICESDGLQSCLCRRTALQGHIVKPAYRYSGSFFNILLERERERSAQIL
ncbi:hypothetical protein AOLI_G00213330 [Acnodon oligacanthus]